MSVYILFPTLLQAQRGNRLLSESGIPAQVVKAPRQMGDKGCAYGVRMSERWLDRSLRVLDAGTIRYGRIFVPEGDGFREART